MPAPNIPLYDVKAARRETVALRTVVTVDNVQGVVSQTPARTSRMTVARTGVGAYTITLQNKWAALLYVGATIAFAAPTAAQGTFVTVTSANVSAETPTIVVQFRRPDTNAAAEVPASCTFQLAIDISNVPDE